MKKINFAIDKLLSDVNKKTFEIGNEYFNLKKVSSIEFESFGGEIVVNAICNNYKNHFEIFNDKLTSVFCECYVGSKSIVCKHIVASILKLNTFANDSFDVFNGVNIEKFHTLINEKNLGALIRTFNNSDNITNYFDILINNNNLTIEVNDKYKFISKQQLIDFIEFIKKINNNKSINDLLNIANFIYDVFENLMNNKNKSFIFDDEIDKLLNLLKSKNIINLFKIVSKNEKFSIDKIVDNSSFKLNINIIQTNIGYVLMSDTEIISYWNSDKYTYLLVKKKNEVCLIKLDFIDYEYLKNLDCVNQNFSDIKKLGKKIDQLKSLNFVNVIFESKNQKNEIIDLKVSIDSNSKVLITISNKEYKALILKYKLTKLLNYFNDKNTCILSKESDFQKMLNIIAEYQKTNLLKITYDDNILMINNNKKIDLKFKIDKINDNVDLSFDVDGKKIKLNNIRKILNVHNDFLNIIKDSKESFYLDKENIKNINRHLSIMNINSDKLDKTKIFYIAREFNEKDFFEFVRKFNNQKVELNIDDFIIKNLKKYQLDGVKWIKKMLTFGGGCLLADEMGLGKTFQSIAYINDLRKRNKKPILIITPFSLLENWKNEFTKFDNSATIIEIDGDAKKRTHIINSIEDGNIYLANYHKFITDIQYYKNKNFSLIILDEGQYIKNNKNIWSKNIKKIKSDERLILTGTPIENNVMDLWSLFDFILPNYLPNESIYKQLFLNTNDNLEELSFLVKPFILQRTKSQELPQLKNKINNLITIDMFDEENKLYDEIFNDIKNDIDLYFNTSIKSESKRKINILSKITKLRQFCCDPTIIYKNTKTGNKTNKIIELVKELVENGNKKIVIFSSFVKALNVVKNQLDEHEITNMMFTGEHNKKERNVIINDFNEIDKCVLLVSLKAGGVGINLTSSNIVIHLNPWWNDSVENQATDRVHRIGQEKVVEVYNLIYSNSIEEDILKLKENKNIIVNTTISSVDYLELFKIIHNK